MAEPDPAAWVAASSDRLEADIRRLALTEASVASGVHGDLRKALAALGRISALADQWYGERGNDYSASAAFGSRLREVLHEELLGEGSGNDG
jgi:Cdc6-like AAA superfamily ATPase